MNLSDRYGTTKRVALWGIIINILLLALKLTVGFAARSQAMIADGFNSAGDVFASFMTYLGNRISSRPEDSEHPYGHGKAEYIFSMIISFSLVLIAYSVFRGALEAMLNRERAIFSWWLVLVALSTIVLKVGLFFYTRKVGRKHDSLLVIANSEDHRNDVFVASGTLVGVLSGVYGIMWIDSVVGMLISVWIAITGFKIFGRAYSVLMDTNIDKSLKEGIWGIVERVEGVDHVDSILAKPIGVGFIVIVKVSVKGSMSVDEGHKVAAIIKERLKKEKNVDDVVVHINPC
jgi:cation diffusion facilitator family transporter